MWSVFGGFLLYFLTSNFLTVLIKPSWEEPIRTIEDLLERDIVIILWPNNEYYIDVMRDSAVEKYNKESYSFRKSQIFSNNFVSSWPRRVSVTLTGILLTRRLRQMIKIEQLKNKIRHFLSGE